VGKWAKTIKAVTMGRLKAEEVDSGNAKNFWLFLYRFSHQTYTADEMAEFLELVVAAVKAKKANNVPLYTTLMTTLCNDFVPEKEEKGINIDGKMRKPLIDACKATNKATIDPAVFKKAYEYSASYLATNVVLRFDREVREYEKNEKNKTKKMKKPDVVLKGKKCTRFLGRPVTHKNADGDIQTIKLTTDLFN